MNLANRILSSNEQINNSAVHYYDSSVGSPHGGGVLFTYSQPFVCIDCYCLSSITIFRFDGIDDSSVYYLTTSLTSAYNSSFRNGKQDAVMAVIPGNGDSDIHLYNHDFKDIRIAPQNLHQISFQLRNQNFDVLKNVRYVVCIKFKCQ